MPGLSQKRVRDGSRCGSPPKRLKVGSVSDGNSLVAAHSDGEKLLAETHLNTASRQTSPATSTSSSASTLSGSSSRPPSSGEDEDEPNPVSFDHDTSQSSSSESDDEPIIVTGRKPSMYQMPTSDLSSRLAAFLPAFKAANDHLEKDIASGKVISVEIPDGNEGAGEGGHEEQENPNQYIEMVCITLCFFAQKANLGLGVLEENPDNQSETSGDHDSHDEGNQQSCKNANILDKLMGNQMASKRPTIEEVDR
ncbi:predicted protein [Uncinocarpus reesii 1704]|uniref:Uncharacterized protein n=1 Tax=Uncinocarpus reesii (strain UAMH 1704) TaxID=336963 RepID=C4JQM4_UNCRE|nr:uncharacterized protein UREG_03369 [Uncinocarpus reesii 1704]EEP78523.1 predicted protein [Uncinocarpus reesii 1704]